MSAGHQTPQIRELAISPILLRDRMRVTRIMIEKAVNTPIRTPARRRSPTNRFTKGICPRSYSRGIPASFGPVKICSARIS